VNRRNFFATLFAPIVARFATKPISGCQDSWFMSYQLVGLRRPRLLINNGANCMT
jgi:hypothetical protein